jgi:hypothetical protein
VSEDQEKAASYALFQMGQALTDLTRLSRTPEGQKYLGENCLTLGAAINELRELSRKATLSAIGWPA